MNTSYKGRVIGFILGFIFAGGIFGGILFMILGYLFVDKAFNKKVNDKRAAYSAFTSNANYNRALVEVTFGLMGYVARGAGRINEDHIIKAKQYMGAMNLDESMRELAIKAFSEGKAENCNLDALLNKLRDAIGNNFSFVEYLLEIQVSMALSDGELTDEEYNRLMEIALKLGVSRASMESFISSRYSEMRFKKQFEQGFSSGSYSYGNSNQGYSNGSYQDNSQGYSNNSSSSATNLDSAYSLLGVDSSVSDDDLKKAYKRLMLKYHPDRLASQGLTPEMINLYTEKAKDIQAAFEVIKKARGIK